MKRTGQATEVTIHLAPGIYHLYEPLRLRPEDSGLTIIGHGAIISGGKLRRVCKPDELTKEGQSLEELYLMYATANAQGIEFPDEAQPEALAEVAATNAEEKND